MSSTHPTHVTRSSPLTQPLSPHLTPPISHNPSHATHLTQLNSFNSSTLGSTHFVQPTSLQYHSTHSTHLISLNSCPTTQCIQFISHNSAHSLNSFERPHLTHPPSYISSYRIASIQVISQSCISRNQAPHVGSSGPLFPNSVLYLFRGVVTSKGGHVPSRSRLPAWAGPSRCLGGGSIVSPWCLGGVLMLSRWCLCISVVSRWHLGGIYFGGI